MKTGVACFHLSRDPSSKPPLRTLCDIPKVSTFLADEKYRRSFQGVSMGLLGGRFNSSNLTGEKSASQPKESDQATGGGAAGISVEKILDLVSPTPQTTLVEIGVGTGTNTLPLAKTAHKVIAIDNSEEMLKVAGQSIRESGLHNIYLKLGEAEKIPLRSKSADQVLASAVLHHTPNPLKAIKEMARVLKKGGKLVIIDYEQHSCEQLREQGGDIWLGFLPQDITDWLKKAGLTNVKITPLNRWQFECPKGSRLGKINVLAFTASKPARHR